MRMMSDVITENLEMTLEREYRVSQIVLDGDGDLDDYHAELSYNMNNHNREISLMDSIRATRQKMNCILCFGIFLAIALCYCFFALLCGYEGQRC